MESKPKRGGSFLAINREETTLCLFERDERGDKMVESHRSALTNLLRKPKGGLLRWGIGVERNEKRVNRANRHSNVVEITLKNSRGTGGHKWLATQVRIVRETRQKLTRDKNP
jgi:hypothetical protein